MHEVPRTFPSHARCLTPPPKKKCSLVAAAPQKLKAAETRKTCPSLPYAGAVCLDSSSVFAETFTPGRAAVVDLAVRCRVQQSKRRGLSGRKRYSGSCPLVMLAPPDDPLHEITEPRARRSFLKNRIVTRCWRKSYNAEGGVSLRKFRRVGCRMYDLSTQQESGARQ